MGKYYQTDAIDIRVSGEDVISDISTKRLEIELEDRKELERNDPEEFKKQEKYRAGTSLVTIDLNDYGLICKNDIEPDFFTDIDLIHYLETHRNYAVFSKGSISNSNVDSVCTYLMDLPKWKFKEFMCDTLGLNHFATVDDILNELKNKLV